MPPLEGEVPNEREAEGFVRKLSNKLSKKTPQSARSGCQLPFQGRRGRFAPGRVHKTGRAIRHARFGLYRDYFAFKIFINSSPVMVSCS